MHTFLPTSVFFKLCFIVSVSILLSGCSIPFRAKQVAGLQVSTKGGEAMVLLNGEEKGQSPFSDQQLKPGEYTVKLVPVDEEFQPYETTIELFQGTLSVIEWDWGETAQESGGVIIEVEPMKSTTDSELSIRSTPDGAIVKVDDASQGFTPVLMRSVTAGSHRYSVGLPGYKEQSHTVTAINGFRMNISLILAKDPELEVVEEVEEATDEATVATSSATAKKTPTSSPKKAVADTTKESTKSATAAKTGTVTILETGTGWLRVREAPNTTGAELAKVDVGDSFPFTDQQNGWYEIEYEEGKTGWVIGTFVKKN